MQQRSMKLCGTITLGFMLLGIVVAGSSPPPASRLSHSRLFSIRPDIVWTAGGHSGPVHAVAYSPDGQMLATGSEDRTVKIWRVADGATLHRLTGHTGIVKSVAFAPDGQLLATGSVDETVRIWRVSDGTLLRSMTHADWGGQVNSVAFSPDGGLLASAGNDRTVKLWRVSDGALHQTLSEHTGAVKSVAFSPDGLTLASGSDDNTIKIWRISDGTVLQTLTEGADCLAFTPDGQTLASSTGRNIRFWRLSDGTVQRTIWEGRTVTSLAFSPDGQTLLSGSGRIAWDTLGKVELWRVSDGQSLGIFINQSDTFSVAFAPDGQTVVSGHRENTYRLWRVSDRALLQTVNGHVSHVNQVALSPDGQIFASSGGDATIKVRRASDGALLQTLTGHTRSVVSIAFSPDSQTLISGSQDRTIKIWRVSDWTLAQTLAQPTGEVYGVAFSPDGQTLAAGLSDTTIQIYRVSDWTVLRTLTGHTASVRSVAFSPDGQLLASGGGDSVRIWRVSDGTLLRTLVGLSTLSVAFSSDGQTLATGYASNAVELWRVSDGTSLRLLWHPGVRAVAFSPDGQLLISGSTDGTMNIWRIADGWLMRSDDEGAGVMSVTFSRNGQFVGHGLGDGSVVWAQAPFLTNQPPFTPTLIAPEDNAEVSLNPTFRVKAIDPNGNKVRIRIDVEDDNDNLVRQLATAEADSGQEVSVSIPADQPLQRERHRWRAVANDGAFDGPFSEWRRFNVGNNFAPTAPVLSKPADGATVSPQPVFELSATQLDNDRLKFKIELLQNSSVVGTFDQTQNAAGWSKTDYGSGEIATFTHPSPLSAGGYQWRASASDGTDWSAPSGTQSFTVATNVAPTPPALTKPASGANVSQQPQFQLSSTDANGDRLKFKIELLQNSSVVGTFDQTQNAAGWSQTDYASGETATFTLASPLAFGDYQWRAYASDGKDWSASSGAQNFTVVVNHPPLKPTLLSPASGGVVHQTPTFQVSASDPEGDTLLLTVELLQGANVVRTFTTAIASGETGSVPVPNEEPVSAGDYTWRAQVYDGYEKSEWSDVRPLTVQPGNRPPSPPLFSVSVDDTGITSPAPLFNLSATDPDGDALKFKIEVLQGASVVRTFDQTQAPDGWDKSSYLNDESATFTTPVNQAFAEGDYRCRAFCSDGREWSAVSEEATFTVQRRVSWHTLTPAGTVTLSPLFQIGFTVENALPGEQFQLRLEFSPRSDFSSGVVAYEQGRSDVWSKSSAKSDDLIWCLPKGYVLPLNSTVFWRARLKPVTGGQWSASSPVRGMYVIRGYRVETPSFIRFGRTTVTRVVFENPYDHEMDYVLKLNVDLRDPESEFQTHVRLWSTAGELIEEFDLAPNQSHTFRWLTPLLPPGRHTFIVEQKVTDFGARRQVANGLRAVPIQSKRAVQVAPVVVVVGEVAATTLLSMWAEEQGRRMALNALGQAGKINPEDGESPEDYYAALLMALQNLLNDSPKYELTDGMKNLVQGMVNDINEMNRLQTEALDEMARLEQLKKGVNNLQKVIDDYTQKILR